MSKIKICILGAGNMGTALAKLIADNGHELCIWNYSGDQEPLEQIKKYRQNKKYLPGVIIPKTVSVCFHIEDAILDADVVFFAVNSQVVESIAKQCVSRLKKGAIVVDVSKGFDSKTGECIPSLLQNFFPHTHVVSLSGPMVATQLAHGESGVFVIATNFQKIFDVIKNLLCNNRVKAVWTKDIFGVEIVQAIKNIYAIGMGMVQGMGWSLNAQSIFFTVAFEEMRKINKALGGKDVTVFGFAGLGDFFTTSLSKEGRNRQFGEIFSTGMNKNTAFAQRPQTIEGISALKIFQKMDPIKKLKLPVLGLISKVVHGKISADKALESFFRAIK